MVFSSVIFLVYFLPLVLFCYFIAPDRWRNTILLLFSLFFYAWGEPKYVFLMLFSIAMNYFFGIFIDKFQDRQRKQKLILVLAVIGNLLILGFFKYFNFMIENVNILLGTSFAIEPIPLPIGISFFTFQAISYLVDVYRKDGEVQRNILNISLYISLFPQLMAGPIVRYQTVAEQLKKRFITLDLFTEGIQRFIMGLAKKVLLANTFGSIADDIFAMDPSNLSTGTAWIGIIAYTLQIYFDFSGYSDMAIGLGLMFGFRFLENFNYPYISKSISEFWRRWHISLGHWFRDYVYIPLGGNRVARWKIYRNLLIVWALTGFWHGASWTFLAWGTYYGIIIMIERMGLEQWMTRLWSPIRHVYVLFIVMIGWVFFRADHFSYAYAYLQTMFGFNGTGILDTYTVYYLSTNGVMIAIGVIIATPVYHLIRKSAVNLPISLRATCLYIVCFFLLSQTILKLVNETYNPFLYFRF